MSTPPVVSVVVATRDRAARLEALLGALRRQTLDRALFEVVVVDDRSHDTTGEVLARELAGDGHGELRLTAIAHRASGGPARARNTGWRSARAPLVAFTDDDCEPAPGWLEAGLRAADERPGGIVQGRTEPNPRELGLMGPFSRTLHVEDAGPWYPTCNIFYPRELLERLDGFDQGFTAPGGEDTDLAWRALEHGAQACFAPAALVYHAVEDLGPAGHLRVALRWSSAMGMFRHRGLRRAVLIRGVFWKRSHALLPQAVAGVALARRFPPALLLALPYLRLVRGRCRACGAPLALAPYFALHDLLETYAAVRGAVRERVIVI